MKHILKKIFSLSLLASTGFAIANDCNTNCNPCNAPAKPVTCFVPRSQSFHNELKNAVMDPYNQFIDVDSFNGSFNVMFEYNHTFNGDKLGKCLFGPAAICLSSCGDDSVAIRVVGSNGGSVNGGNNPNGVTDLVADSFFLPRDFISTITIEPSIQNFNVHFQAYFGFDEWCPGLYARVYGPVAVSRWKLETSENITSAGTDANGSYAAGAIGLDVITTANLYSSFLSYTQGKTLPNNGQLPNTTNPPVTGPVVQPLKYTRFGACDTDTTTQFADLRAELGWNFLLDEDYHLGLYIAAAAPTGDDCDGDCDNLLWGAKAGNGAHWELGGGLTGHYTMWRAEECDQRFDFFVDATINHMFAHTEQRTFDLKGKPLSRYIIAEQLGAATNGLTYGAQVGGTAATYQFNSVYAPVANFGTFDVSVSFPVQADVMAKFVYTCKGFSWALGYDFWAQTCPSVELACNDSCDATPFAANTWALKGDAHVYGYEYNANGAVIAIQPIPATDSTQTAFTVSTAFESTSGNVPIANTNQGINNATVPLTVATPAGNGDLIVVPTDEFGNSINGSNPPVFIAQSDFDICNVGRGMSNSIFTELNYTWTDRECWIPYLGIGARVEFGSNPEGGTYVNPTANNANNNCCDNCDTCTASVWGVWIKGGLSFN